MKRERDSPKSKERPRQKYFDLNRQHEWECTCELCTSQDEKLRKK